MKSQCQRAALFVLFLLPATAATLPAFGESAQDGPTTAPTGYHRASAPSNPRHPGRAKAHQPAFDTQQERVGRRLRSAEHRLRELLGQLAQPSQK